MRNRALNWIYGLVMELLQKSLYSESQTIYKKYFPPKHRQGFLLINKNGFKAIRLFQNPKAIKRIPFYQMKSVTLNGTQYYWQ